MTQKSTSKQKTEAGFSLIELMVIIAIIGVLYTIVAISLQSSRAKARDSRRAADIKQLATALEGFYTQNSAYPVQPVPATTIPGLDINYIGQIPVAPLPAEENCLGNNDYLYESADGVTYTVTFCLGDNTGDYTPGVHQLTEKGVE